MIKTWSIFNENNDNIKDVLSKKLSEVVKYSTIGGKSSYKISYERLLMKDYLY